MSDNAFVDTNVFVYARDKGAGSKQAEAEALLVDLWETRRGRVSVQVLSEYFVTVTRKLKPGMTARAAWADVVTLQAWAPVGLDWKLLQRAHVVFQQDSISWWDALIIAAAQEADCETLYSEDLTDGEVYGGVRVVNPFAA